MAESTRGYNFRLELAGEEGQHAITGGIDILFDLVLLLFLELVEEYGTLQHVYR